MLCAFHTVKCYFFPLKSPMGSFSNCSLLLSLLSMLIKVFYTLLQSVDNKAKTSVPTLKVNVRRGFCVCVGEGSIHPFGEVVLSPKQCFNTTCFRQSRV